MTTHCDQVTNVPPKIMEKDGEFILLPILEVALGVCRPAKFARDVVVVPDPLIPVDCVVEGQLTDVATSGRCKCCVVCGGHDHSLIIEEKFFTPFPDFDQVIKELFGAFLPEKFLVGKLDCRHPRYDF